ncbi:hypothetical protein HYH02_010907 [Chlamydomonas schloesseri]|uniref:RING-type domain-containing protein n=1 Tax=Chlamydomonas schloesseri TaxID=2026947 RepID=A0A835T7I4_9CHLO|nr:hypothetical protein HYH02_010907 [Chlamydomonas schloesseri]|eukprot:KAG2438452.1 hypothetical protein HYH02_010907 [Chlamydomonas schloesseri]
MSLYTRPDGGARSISMRDLASLPFDSLVSAVAPTDVSVAPRARQARSPSPAPAAQLRRRSTSSGRGPGAVPPADISRRPLMPLGDADAASAFAPQDDHMPHSHWALHHSGAGGGRVSPMRRQPSSLAPSMGASGEVDGGGRGLRGPGFGGHFGGARSFGGGVGVHGMGITMGLGLGLHSRGGGGGSILDGLHLPPLAAAHADTRGQQSQQHHHPQQLGHPGLLGPRSHSSPSTARTRGRQVPAAAAAGADASPMAAVAAMAEGLLDARRHVMRRAGSLLSALAGHDPDPLQQLVEAVAAPGLGLGLGLGQALGRDPHEAGLGGLLGPRVVLRRAVSAGRQRSRGYMDAGASSSSGWEGLDFGIRDAHRAHAPPSSPRPRVVEVDEDGWEVPPPELLRQSVEGPGREPDVPGAGGRRRQPQSQPQPQSQQPQRSASTGRHHPRMMASPPSGSNNNNSAGASDDGWLFAAAGFLSGGPAFDRLFPLPGVMPLGPLGEVLGGLGRMGLGRMGLGRMELPGSMGMGLGPVLLPHGLAVPVGGGGMGAGGMRPRSAVSSGGWPPSAAGDAPGGGGGGSGGSGEGYEALVALDEGRVKRVVRPEVVRALPTRTAGRSDASQQCGVCLERCLEGATVLTTLPCGHAFCSGCVEPWLGGQSATCPTCRWAFPQDQTHLLMEPQ